ncbi:putative Fatty acyl-CoA reductase 2 [Hypsibius exemplaris]|uniref:Fatty acyl-CoA reductase n=1 Tax=Hypsibius exemplaris TaxID=2072580 RepID=A0A1W0WXT9_HYPEX|nr:putative Fatty acyl-CoA reductase 2 [Hypsibius exemplaris]
MRQLEAIVHVSTAYSNCHLKKIEEKIYPSPFEPNQLMDALQKRNTALLPKCGWDEGVLKAMTPGLIPPWPNTYTYAKALAETIIISDGRNRFSPVFNCRRCHAFSLSWIYRPLSV